MFFKSVISCFNLCLRICCINSLLQSWSRAYKYHMLYTNTRFLTAKQYNNTYGLYLQCPFSPTWFHSSWWAFFLLIKKLLIYRFPSIISEKTKMNISTCTSSNILQKIKHNFPPNYIFMTQWPHSADLWPPAPVTALHIFRGVGHTISSSTCSRQHSPRSTVVWVYFYLASCHEDELCLIDPVSWSSRSKKSKI